MNRNKSKIRHFSGASGSPSGAGISVIYPFKHIAYILSVFADTAGQSCAGIPMISSISCLVPSTVADGRSICLYGKYFKVVFYCEVCVASVLRFYPCVASTTSNAPSHAAREANLIIEVNVSECQ